MKAAATAAGALAFLTRLITGVRARGLGADAVDSGPAGQRVYFANHTSHLDTLVIWASLPAALRRVTRPVAAADYWDRPGPRRWLACEVLNALLVDRAGGGGSREALRRIDGALASGDSLILFPEGTRGDGSHIGELKPGLYFIAHQRPGVALVPVYLQNLSRILPKGEVLPVPILGSAVFGPPLTLNPGEARQAFLDRARAALLGLAQPAAPPCR